ncbi:MAG: UDP-N-acetylmuramoyl-L-alanyl-D-glutamate--2,6-diaminopimelate ligase [Chloroflexi bacterium]|nr:MAG: UDP-N-acetylmuramoyl-L-alanyl-D-glutamate--2,6-diaminopimelate ligase [Chloroflexota bacterium]MBL1197475.1 UDP-N-acetylmuramoyl-L-alanyl-D-glutamate--2,6-diaminopimelate ligase [Chloroflexota bacterium]
MTDKHQASLEQLFAEHTALSTIPDIQVSGIKLDSRQVQPGDLFVALAGGSVDGHDYINKAAEKGAVAAVGTQTLGDTPIPYVPVEDGRGALAAISAAFYGYPARKLTMIGVTGTDGKTTTANFIYHILQAAGIHTGMISTVNALIREEVLDTGFHVTTPEAPDVQRYLSMMVEAGLTHCILEATSHGLEQQRVGACDFDIGVVTNITHEHLDYHGSYEGYQMAKARLFTGLAESYSKAHNPPRAAILNRDDGSYEYLPALSKVDQIAYGLHPEAQVRAEGIQSTPQGLAFNALLPNSQFPITTNLLGDYNVSNILAALSATVVVLGIDPEVAQQGITALPGVPGRMEPLDLGQDFVAMVDFAHTPNALIRALQAARKMAKGRVIAVFGSAGLRDRDKRRMMAESSAELADLTVLTAEDPRTESLDDILEEMAEGARSKGGVEEETFWRVRDRGAAIRYSLDLAQPGDLVVALGKGHEQSMCFGVTEYPWDDRTALHAALADYLGVEGPKMPYLPTQD